MLTCHSVFTATDWLILGIPVVENVHDSVLSLAFDSKMFDLLGSSRVRWWWWWQDSLHVITLWLLSLLTQHWYLILSIVSYILFWIITFQQVQWFAVSFVCYRACSVNNKLWGFMNRASLLWFTTRRETSPLYTWYLYSQGSVCSTVTLFVVNLNDCLSGRENRKLVCPGSSLDL